MVYLCYGASGAFRAQAPVSAREKKISSIISRNEGIPVAFSSSVGNFVRPVPKAEDPSICSNLWGGCAISRLACHPVRDHQAAIASSVWPPVDLPTKTLLNISGHHVMQWKVASSLSLTRPFHSCRISCYGRVQPMRARPDNTTKPFPKEDIKFVQVNIYGYVWYMCDYVCMHGCVCGMMYVYVCIYARCM